MKKKSVTKKSLPSPEEVKRILEGTNWDDYQRQVDERVAQEVDALALARVRSLAEFGHSVFLSTAAF